MPELLGLLSRRRKASPRAPKGRQCGVDGDAWDCRHRALDAVYAVKNLRGERIVGLGEEKRIFARAEDVRELSGCDVVGVTRDNQAIDRVILPNLHRQPSGRWK